MAKRNKNSGGGVNLFPFMSILACLIGILTLMISVSMQLKQLDREGRTKEETDRAIANRTLKREAEQARDAIAQLKQRIQTEKKTAADLARIEEAKIVLRLKLEELAKAREDGRSDDVLQKLVENLKKEIAALKRERPALDRKLAKLREDLAKLAETPKPEPTVVVRPGGVGRKQAQSLFFIDCNSTGIVLYRDGKPSGTVSTASIRTNESYNSFLDEVKRGRDPMILFLVRKAGGESHAWAADWAEKQYQLSHGKLPIPNDGKIDLSLFN